MIADEDNPWLGLASFTEETQAFFFGREQEIADLERRVQRKLLTVLFGKSGLGKTSILRAGLVPRLRARGYVPVYLRIDYQHDSPEAAEQIKQAIARAAATGRWTQSGVAIAGESIWEFLHHRDDVLKDATGATLTPLLIFDQFEEVFTLAQSDEFGRARAARFVEELADLVENRLPKALETKLDSDESIAEHFDFSRSDYRVVIALREDYLAPLESLKKHMPSLSQNRLRLAPMTGNQALEAVLLPGKHLLTQEVAEAIVRFVAGGAELANAEVEPSLLSLICRELNEQRLAQHRSEISLDLLAGSREGILTGFYERSLVDQPASVRRLIEDELLTESGYRENLAEERLLRRLQSAGVSADALATLVNRRLLRIEDRLDVRRVELTHDVLSGVVKASRDQRHEREVREATERTLAEQRAREQAARHALRRARAIAAGCVVLAALAIAAAAAAFLNVQRARRAEADARQTRAVSEQAREQAEGLLGYLTDDFVQELQSFGRYQVIAELSQREIDYFGALPAALKDPETVRNGAQALVDHAWALLYLGGTNAGAQSAAAAIALLEPLRRAGDRSESTTVTLSRAYRALAALRQNQGSPEVLTDDKRAADLLRPIVGQPGASREARRAYVEAMSDIGRSDVQITNKNEDSVRAEREAIRVAIQLGAGSQGDLTLDQDYAYAGAWLTEALTNLDRGQEARRAGTDALRVANRLLAQRPQFGATLFDKFLIESALADGASNDLDPAESLRYATQDEQTSLAVVALEPANALYADWLASAYTQVSEALWAQGRLREAIAYTRRGMDALGPFCASGPNFAMHMNLVMDDAVARQVQLGDATGVATTLAAGDVFMGKGHVAGSYTAVFAQALRASLMATLAYERDDFGAARRIAHDAVAPLQNARPVGPEQTALTHYALYNLADIEGHAEYRLGEFAAAAQSEGSALQDWNGSEPTADVADQRTAGQVSIWLTMALAAQGRRADAARTIGPVVQMYRTLAARNHGDQWLPLEFAGALYAQSMTDPRQRAALLREAAQLVDQLVPTISVLHDTRAWRTRIQQALQARATRL